MCCKLVVVVFAAKRVDEAQGQVYTVSVSQIVSFAATETTRVTTAASF